MKVVIDIPEEYYTETNVYGAMSIIAKAVCEGTPLPKGHGRLIDVDKLEGVTQLEPCGNGMYKEVTVYTQNEIDCAPTIIEADKEVEE